jgi:hypothetical protein
MSKLESLARRLVLVWGLALGCADGVTEPPSTPGPTPTPTSTDPAVVYSTLEADMARLNALEGIDAHTLVVEGAAGAQVSNCYSLHPCAYEAAKPEVAAEYARQAPRLNRLASIAEAAARSQYPAAGAVDTAADLAALNALRIVQFGDLVKQAPDTSALCYGLPCADEVARADAENKRRAAVLHGFAAGASQDEGL